MRFSEREAMSLKNSSPLIVLLGGIGIGVVAMILLGLLATQLSYSQIQRLSWWLSALISLGVFIMAVVYAPLKIRRLAGRIEALEANAKSPASVEGKLV